MPTQAFEQFNYAGSKLIDVFALLLVRHGKLIEKCLHLLVALQQLLVFRSLVGYTRSEERYNERPPSPLFAYWGQCVLRQVPSRTVNDLLLLLQLCQL